MGGVRKVTGGREGTDLEEFGAGGTEVKLAGGYDMGLKLFDVGERVAFLYHRHKVCHSIPCSTTSTWFSSISCGKLEFGLALNMKTVYPYYYHA